MITRFRDPNGLLSQILTYLDLHVEVAARLTAGSSPPEEGSGLTAISTLELIKEAVADAEKVFEFTKKGAQAPDAMGD